NAAGIQVLDSVSGAGGDEICGAAGEYGEAAIRGYGNQFGRTHCIRRSLRRNTHQESPVALSVTAKHIRSFGCICLRCEISRKARKKDPAAVSGNLGIA